MFDVRGQLNNRLVTTVAKSCDSTVTKKMPRCTVGMPMNIWAATAQALCEVTLKVWTHCSKATSRSARKHCVVS